MSNPAFFRSSARECRELARRAASDSVRWELLLWAREFDAIAADGAPRRRPAERQSARSFLRRFTGARQRDLEPAD